MERTHQDRTPREPEFGVLMAPVDGQGTWAVLKDLREKLRALRSDGSPQVIFIDALDGEGRAVGARDPAVAALVLGYRLDPSRVQPDPEEASHQRFR